MRRFALVWSGQTLSLIGSGLTGFAMGVHVYQETGSVTRFSLVTLANFVPAIVVSPFAGVLVDRWDRRRTMMLSDSLAALTSLTLLLICTFAELELWHIVLATALSSACGALQSPAYAAATTLLCPKEHLGRASGLIQLGYAGQHVVSPLLAGVLLEPLGLRGIICVDLSTFLFSLIILFFSRFPRPPASDLRAPRGDFFAELRFGLDFIRARPGLLALLVFITCGYFFGAFVIVLDAPLMLSFTDAETLGRQLSIGGLGLVAGGGVLSLWGGPKGRRVRFLVAAELANAACMIAGSLRPSVLLLTVVGFFWFLSTAMIISNDQTMWLLKVPADVQGRVLGTKRMFQLSAMPLAYAIAGPLVDHVATPLMAVNGALRENIGLIIGTGPGRGIALILLVAGVLKAALACFMMRRPRLVGLERELPDAVEDGSIARVV